MKIEDFINPWLIGMNESKRIETIRLDLISRVTPDTTDEEKSAMQVEFNQRIDADRERVRKEETEAYEANTRLFLSNPREAYNVILGSLTNQEKVGEKILSLGIAMVKIKRRGKGVIIGARSDFSYTLSNFEVTGTIGQFSMTTLMHKGNDRHDKIWLESQGAGLIAEMLARGLTEWVIGDETVHLVESKKT